MSALALDQLKKQLGSKLIAYHRASSSSGLPTGDAEFDQFLAWKGLPKTGLSYFYGDYGLGATSLGLQAASNCLTEKKWVAWLGQSALSLCPWPLVQKGIPLSQFLMVSANPDQPKQLLWIIQELLSLSLFDLILCDLGESKIKTHQLMKLNKLMRQQNCGLLFLSSKAPYSSCLFSLVVQFSANFFTIERALHRPTPHILQRRSPHANLMPQFAKERKSLSR